MRNYAFNAMKNKERKKDKLRGKKKVKLGWKDWLLPINMIINYKK